MLCLQVCMVALVGYACECVVARVCVRMCVVLRLSQSQFFSLIHGGSISQFNREIADIASQLSLGTPSIMS